MYKHVVYIIVIVGNKDKKWKYCSKGEHRNQQGDKGTEKSGKISTTSNISILYDNNCTQVENGSYLSLVHSDGGSTDQVFNDYTYQLDNTKVYSVMNNGSLNPQQLSNVGQCPTQGATMDNLFLMKHQNARQKAIRSWNIIFMYGSWPEVRINLK